jgi:N-alpha-acetyl-L-2,4-diaminobutyrate deacetylase
MVADFLYRHVLPLADCVCDIHSGGKTMYFSPFGAIHALDDKALTERARKALAAFDPPIGLVLRELDAEGMLDTAVEAMGKIFVTTELGGGGTTTAGTIAIADRGVRNLLKHFALVEGEPETRAKVGLPPMRMMTMPDDAYVIADHAGLLEMMVDIDARVNVGQPIARIYNIDRPGDAPAVYCARADGVLLGRSHLCLVKPGDFLAMVAQDA